MSLLLWLCFSAFASLFECISGCCGAVVVFFFQAEDGIRDLVRSRGLGDVYKRQGPGCGSPVPSPRAQIPVAPRRGLFPRTPA